MRIMSKDYYAVLGLARNATDLDINKAYRSLSLLWNPTRHPSNGAQAEANFQQISEAFQVLSNRHLRRLYDRHGKKGLMEDRLIELNFDGFQPRSTEFPFSDPMDVYLEFFGGRDPLAHTYPGSSNRQLFVYDEHCFENSFPGFTRPTTKSNTIEASPSGRDKSPSYLFTGSMFSGPNDEGDYMSVCRKKQIINGKQIVTTREVLNDEENVTVEEDGIVISKTINGELEKR